MWRATSRASNESDPPEPCFPQHKLLLCLILCLRASATQLISLQGATSALPVAHTPLAPRGISARSLGRSRLRLLGGNSEISFFLVLLPTASKKRLSPAVSPLGAPAFLLHHPPLPCLCSMPLAGLTQPSWKSVSEKGKWDFPHRCCCRVLSQTQLLVWSMDGLCRRLPP